jgi:hypothetical protein
MKLSIQHYIRPCIQNYVHPPAGTRAKATHHTPDSVDPKLKTEYCMKRRRQFRVTQKTCAFPNWPSIGVPAYQADLEKSCLI